MDWGSITSSGDGTHLAAVVGNGDIWTSDDSGATWTDETTGTSASGLQWTSITSSSDGTHLAATVDGGDIWTSSDSGATWTNETTGTPASGLGWYGITSSADGTHLAAVVGNGDIWTSDDSGATWTNDTANTSLSGLDWSGITSSSDGTKLLASNHGGYLYTSTDGGATWTQQTAAGQEYWGDGTPTLGSSADGTKLVAAGGYDGDIWTASLVFPPSVTTSAASSIGATSAMGNGGITDVEGENPETVGFVYGATTAYGATTTESGSFSTGSFSATISSLTCNATYHFAAYATNSGGTGYGSDQSFTTSACPSGGGGMIVGSGPLAPAPVPTAPPRPQIDYPNGTIVYLGATTTASTSPTASIATPAASSTSYQFTVNHELWDEGPDILALQQWLNTHGFPLVSTGWGSAGSETDTFGLYTYAALIKFQEANNLPATGFFGPLTRAAIGSMSTTSIAQ